MSLSDQYSEERREGGREGGRPEGQEGKGVGEGGEGEKGGPEEGVYIIILYYNYINYIVIIMRFKGAIAESLCVYIYYICAL